EMQTLRVSCHVPMAMPVEDEPPTEIRKARQPAAQGYHALRPVDRRAAPRRQANQVLISISCALDDSPPFEGWVLDYSPVGLGLFVDARMVVGAYLHGLPLHDSAYSFSLDGQVKYCQAFL